jgi:hypothetical protein
VSTPTCFKDRVCFGKLRLFCRKVTALGIVPIGAALALRFSFSSHFLLADALMRHFRFLLPALQIKEILDQVTKSDVRRALRNLSADIGEAFQSTIDRIKGQSGSRRNLAFRTLMFISYAKRNLTIDELRHALAVRMEDEELDRDNLLSLKTILDSCNGLVEVAESSKLRFVHFTLEGRISSIRSRPIRER